MDMPQGFMPASVTRYVWRGLLVMVQSEAAQASRGQELLTFFVLAVLMWPIIAVVFVGTYGFAFWVYFILSGPPGPS